MKSQDNDNKRKRKKKISKRIFNLFLYNFFVEPSFVRVRLSMIIDYSSLLKGDIIMDNPDQRKDVSTSEQPVRRNSVNRERFRQVKDERYYRERNRIRNKAKRDRRRQAKLNATSVQHNIHKPQNKPQNFQRQISPGYLHRPSPERFGRNHRSNRYDYDVRTRNDGYTTRRQNYTQSSRMSGSRRGHYYRSDRKRSLSPYSSNTRSCDSSRRYNNSPSPYHRRRSPESPGPTSSIKEPIIRINTQFASSSYLGKASEVTKSLKDPLPKLLVLDLNGTLVYRANGKRDIILRPFMSRFMKYIFDSSNNFAVMVWSSAQPKNVDKMVRAAFGQYEENLVAKWTRKHLNLSDQDYHQKVETIKDLEKVWKELNKSKITTLQCYSFT
ncbi:HAD-like protein [Rhizophagus clarus]|uniref:Mitochondrial import inner membrane translocase subunit TIM50 n=1 Tax=Rhizophagus clarus TaxID=94130 RepID=A0A8H3QPW4_9GLOM|nr:HAD-like protein [Rhizophagus clarus]